MTDIPVRTSAHSGSVDVPRRLGVSAHRTELDADRDDVGDDDLELEHFRYGADLPKGRRHIAPYAASAIPSRGRRFAEQACPTRTDVQRDRDRIVHASAFRRLTYKTQVFVFHEDDNYRTRLTHSLEVAQIARTIARQLCLDEDLAEAIALAHDLGHPPFGHAGERALDAQLFDCGGFDLNVLSLRVVTELERKY
ncbi:MAG: dGTP triphosphohydrolase, partial [Pseudomonadota bacterium]